MCVNLERISLMEKLQKMHHTLANVSLKYTCQEKHVVPGQSANQVAAVAFKAAAEAAKEWALPIKS